MINNFLKKSTFRLSLFIIAVSSLLHSCHSIQKKGLIDVDKVHIKSGIISGTVSEDGLVKIFEGIPFAAPPVGELRWKAPQPVKAWPKIRACVTPPASAMQNKPEPFYCWSREFLIPEKPVNEDCLYLNVWTPAKRCEEKLPVVVWIHGGALTSGSGTVPLYNGEAMARKGVVFITINYRLGIFGFLAHPELSAESNHAVSGNYGLLDQIAALQWIQENITSFGGDPSQVTIAGQSAGAFSVNMLMVSPCAKGLFCRAIAQSGALFEENAHYKKNLREAEENGKQLTDRLGIYIADLRKMPADSLLQFPVFSSFTVDNVIIPPVCETFEAGKQNDVALLTGWNAGDEDSFGQNNCRWAQLQTKTGRNPAYLYYFRRVPPGQPDYGAFHSAEIAYALHTLKYWERPFVDTDYRLEEIMSLYWVNFAKTGNPNSLELPQWPAFNGNKPMMIELGDEVRDVLCTSVR